MSPCTQRQDEGCTVNGPHLVPPGSSKKKNMFMTPHSLKQASSGSRLATPGVVYTTCAAPCAARAAT
jgi:hypothetical protein